MVEDRDTYDLHPTKQAYKSLRSDVNPISAVKELVDNVLDNWRQADQHGEPDLTIDIDFDFDNDRFRIEDNSGGISDDEIKNIFALGGTTDADVPWSIGSYGMGAKKAIVRLGNKTTIKSRIHDADTGYGYTITEDWFESKNWTVSQQLFDSFPTSTTVIEIEDIQIEIGDEENEEASTEESDEEESEATPEYESEEDFLDDLRGDLSETYQEFLAGRAGHPEGELTIVVNGESINTPTSPDWTYTPFDGLHPRRFQNYKLDLEKIPDREEPIEVTVEAGLLRRGESAEAGTDIIIQDRKILSNEKGEEGGWGSALPDSGPQKRRTKFIVKIRAEENPEDLPWDTQKSHIDTNNPVAQRVFNFLRRAGGRYAKATYEDFPISFTKPYTAESEHSVEDCPETFDYSWRTDVKHKPESGQPQAAELMELVDTHKQWGIFAPNVVDDQFEPAYRAQYDPEEHSWREDYEPNEREKWIFPEEASDLDRQELHSRIEVICSLAEEHSSNSERINFGGQRLWWKGYYERKLAEGSDSLDDLDADISIPSVSERAESLELQEEDEDSQLTDSSTPDEQSEGEDSDDVSDGEDTSRDSSEDTKEDSETEDETDEDEVNEVVDEQETDDDDDDGLDLGTSEESSKVQGIDGSENAIYIDVSNNDFEAICDELELSPQNSSPTEVGREVKSQEFPLIEFLNGETEQGD